MSKIIIALLLIVGYYVHGRWMFSDMHVQRWVAEHSARAMSGDSKACDDFTDNVEVNLVSHNRGGRWEVEGGKNEICGYLRQASAAFILLQAQTNTRFENLSINRSGFPWTSATVSYTEHTTINSANLPTINATSKDTLVISRTLGGLKIKSLNSTGGLK